MPRAAAERLRCAAQARNVKDSTPQFNCPETMLWEMPGSLRHTTDHFGIHGASIHFAQV